MRSTTRAAGWALPLLLLLGTLLVPLPAEARSPAVAVDIPSDEILVDASVHASMVAQFSGTVSISDNGFQSSTVDLSVDAGTWTTEITPSQKVATGNDTFSWSAVVTLSADALQGVYPVRVIAKAETPGWPAQAAQDSLNIRLIRNRVRAECLQPAREARAGETVNFTVKVWNDGDTQDTFLSSAERRTGRPDRFSLLLDQGSLDVGPGDFFYVNVQVELAGSARAGDYVAVYTARSSASEGSYAEVPLTVTIPGTPRAAAVPPGPNYLLWSGISVLIVGVCLMIFIGGTEIGLLAFLNFVLVPLFVRIKKDQVLDHFTRGQIFGFIKANPGTHYIAIQEHLELQNGVLAYHLNVLEREEYITSERDSIYKRFYPRHMKIPRKERQLSRVQRDIVSALGTHPGTSQNGLARMLGESKQVIGYHIRVLSKAGLVRVEHDAQQTRCYLEGAPAGAAPEPEPVAPEELPEIVRDIHA